MVGVFDRIKNFFGFVGYHRQVIDTIAEMEVERKKDDTRIKALEKATIDGDEGWFLRVAKKDPSCALRVIEECAKDASR